jgi:hypothetical protein
MSQRLLILFPLLAALVGCNARYSNASFHLPPGASAERGQAAFVELGCSGCHQVVGVNLPKTDSGPVTVVLGGEVDRKMTDAYLVTHVLDPNFRPPSSTRARMTTTVEVRMPAFADRITVRQLTDIVAFLQVHYRLRAMPPETWYH